MSNISNKIPAGTSDANTPKPENIKAVAEKAAAIAESTTVDENTPAPLGSHSLSDEFIPPSPTGEHPVKAKPGFVVTPVMALPSAMSQYASAAGVVFVTYDDAPKYVENTALLNRGTDGLARYADCVIAVETQKHYESRMAYKNSRNKSETENTGQTARSNIMAGIKNEHGFPVEMSPNAKNIY